MEDQLGKALASRLNKQQMEKMLYLNEYFQLGPLLNLARERPLLISGLVETYWRTRAEPVLDYVPGLWMRIDLFRRLQDNIKRHELSFVPSMTVFALFMVAPIDVLRSRLDNLERNAQEKNTAEVQEFIEQCRNTVAVIQECMLPSRKTYNSMLNENFYADAFPL